MKTDIKETDNGYELVVDLPGFTKDEVQATLENGYLTISAEKGLDKEEIVGAGVGVPGPADEEGNVPVAVNPPCGMVKDDRHRTRGLYYNNVEIPIDRDSEGFKLITRVQDEAHRFAIEYHRSLRSKDQVHSILDDIDGIGPARRKALMRHFLSLEAIREASEEELAAVPSMTALSAGKVYAFFHEKKKEEQG
mgnify:CR=1 FL=1